MSLFRYGRDYYTDATAQQLSTAAAWLFVAVAGVVIAVHLLRRSAGHPVSTAPTVKLAAGARVPRYEVGARLYHWGSVLFAAGLVLSGIALFAPGAFGDGPWLLVHEGAAAAFVAALILHVVVAPRRGDARTMWFEAADVRDLRVIVANFLGRTRDYPAFGKYDPLQKLFHAWLTVLVAGLLVSGLYLVLSAHAWASFGHEWMRVMRLVHDVTAFAFVAAIVVHVYFGVIRVNWPQLVSMWTGRLRGSSFNLYHDAARWRPRE
jgi:Ni/Fe-hydrogenase 1 B-type cytochrome subunit